MESTKIKTAGVIFFIGGYTENTEWNFMESLIGPMPEHSKVRTLTRNSRWIAGYPTNRELS